MSALEHLDVSAERFFGPPNVEKLKAKGNVKGLIKALGYEKDATIRQAADEVLGEIGDTRAVEPLIAAIKPVDYK